MFQPRNFIADGHSIIGTCTHDERPIMAAVALTEGLKPKHKKDLEAELRAQIAHMLNSDAEDMALAALFEDPSKNAISVPVRDPARALSIVSEVLQLDQDRFIFLCEDQQSYLSVCTELGLSKPDFLKVNQLKHLLNEDEIAPGSVRGSAHKLLRALRDKKVTGPGVDMRPKKIREKLENDLLETVKFKTIDMGQSWEEFVAKGEFQAGDYRLPYKKCLFEFDVPPHPQMGAIKNYLVTIDTKDNPNYSNPETRYVSYFYGYYEQQKQFFFYGHGPAWDVNEAGQITRYKLGVMHSGTQQYFLSHGWNKDPSKAHFTATNMLMRIGSTLMAINQPNATLIRHQPKGFGTKERQNIRFFEYHEVDISNLKNEHGAVTIGRALDGRKGVAFHEVRGHMRPSLNRYIDPYHRGDPAYGIINKDLK